MLQTSKSVLVNLFFYNEKNKQKEKKIINIARIWIYTSFLLCKYVSQTKKYFVTQKNIIFILFDIFYRTIDFCHNNYCLTVC